MSAIIRSVEEFKENFVKNEGKNTFFKKSQKLNCAKAVCDNFSAEELIRNTIYIIPNTNRILIDYTVFKLYAQPEVYESIVNYLIHVYDTVLSIYTSFEVHVILDGFTISAAERYKDVIQLICRKCNTTTNYSLYISQMYVYYTPSMMDSITTLLKPFVDDSLTNKITMYSKTDSPGLLKALVEST